ncbi:uncharacterized protein LOC106089923 [Stomoxys calcitrans]|uniref:uncharacterized protein LOC106089923 n=1 Tax=Stomoxys calcitrans TaxID=35570 RepID=UPI0027E39246|nr:uncharacterized protein LOC106089923 [Stomoxys calcitrans]
MKILLVSLAIIAAACADVSHLGNRYLPPNHQHQLHHHSHGQESHNHQHQHEQPRNQRPTNERVETTIEKHEVIELPTQIEIVKDGQPIYGVQSMSTHIEPMPELRTRYLPPSHEIENLQPPTTQQPRSQQVPYEMPMRNYLPPVHPEMTTTTDVPSTTTEVLRTTTDLVAPDTTTYTAMKEETTEPMTTTMPMSTTTTTTEQDAYESTTLSAPEPTTMPRNRYLPPTSVPAGRYLPPPVSMPEQEYLSPPQSQYLAPNMPEKQYLPPMDVMLPPPSPMPQPTYQQYQEQLVREQQMHQMYREEQMNDMMNAISQMEQQNMITLEPTNADNSAHSQMQPVAPAEPAHVLRSDGYHYKTANDDLRRFRYRH